MLFNYRVIRIRSWDPESVVRLGKLPCDLGLVWQDSIMSQGICSVITNITMVASCLEPRPALIGPDNTTSRQHYGRFGGRRALGLDVNAGVRRWLLPLLQVCSAWPYGVSDVGS